MDLRRLRYFVTVAERLSFTQAARQLGIAQPPLSVQIRNLETEVGGALFYREGRTIRLTPLGLHLLEEARALLSQADRVSESVRDAAEGRSGQLRILYTQGALSKEVTRRIRKFLRKNRGIRFTAIPSEYAAGPFPPADATITETLKAPAAAIVLEHARMQVAVPPKHRLADRSEATLSDLIGESLFLVPFAFRSPLESWIVGQIDSSGLKINLAEGPVHFSDLCWLVSIGSGVAVCSSEDRDTLDAVRVDLAGAPELSTVCIPDPASRAVALAAFMEAIRE